MSHPSNHIHRQPPHADGRMLVPPGWRRWSRAWTRQVSQLAARDDLTVLVAPGAGHGAPACYIPQLATIHVDAALIGQADIADPWRPGHKKQVPAAYGALVHEAAHARHSAWDVPAHTPAVLTEVAHMLEESRVERRQRQRRPRDRQWLRHCVRTVVPPSLHRTDTLWSAATAAGLLLARVDAGVLTYADTRLLRATVTGILGRTRLRVLRRLWREAHLVDDHDGDRLMVLARRWCESLDIDPERQPEVPHPTAAGVTSTGVGQAIDATLSATRSSGAASAASTAGTAHQDPSRAAASADTTRPAAGTSARSTDTRTGRRPPTSQERRAALRLARLLQHARTREPEATRHASALPPGRLQTRQAIAAEAQAAAGGPVTALPWLRTHRRQPPEPQLTIAVVVDTSGSMTPFAHPLASTAWILAHAAARIGATCTTIGFGRDAAVLVPPRQQPAQVQLLHPGAGSTGFRAAVAKAEQLVDLQRPDVVALLVVVSDGEFGHERQPAQDTVTRLYQAGVRILWLAPAGNYTAPVYQHTTAVRVDDPSRCIDLIGRAAADALAAG